GGRFQQRERAQQFGPPRSEAHADEPSHGKADEVARRSAQLLDDLLGIARERVHVVAGFGDLALALPAEVEADAAVLAAKRLDLEAEGRRAPEEAMGEHDGLSRPAAVLVLEFRPVDLDSRHARRVAARLTGVHTERAYGSLRLRRSAAPRR